MKRKNKLAAFTLTELLVVLGFYMAVPITILLLLGLWTERNLEFVIGLAKGQPVDFPYWVAVIAGIVAPFTILFNIVAEIIRAAV